MKKLGEILDREKVAGYVFILPFIIGLLVFTVIPFFTSLYLAFTDYNVLSDPKWIGFDNFKRMFFEDKHFWNSFWITFRFALIQVPIKMCVSLGVALILARATKATSIYGNDYTVNNSTMIFTKDGVDLMFLVSDGNIVSIEYMMVTE